MQVEKSQMSPLNGTHSHISLAAISLLSLHFPLSEKIYPSCSAEGLEHQRPVIIMGKKGTSELNKLHRCIPL